MKRLLLLFVSFAMVASSLAASNLLIKNRNSIIPNASRVLIPVGTTGKTISLMDLSTLSRQQLETMTGKKMNFFERLAFKKVQKKLRKGISEDGTVTDKKLQKHLGRSGDTGFHLGGFALGFFLGLIGVLIAYLINDDYKRNRVKWAWIGWALWVVLWLVLVLSIL